MPSMTSRAAWLRERRRIAEERMDELWAPIYDQQWGGTIDPTHLRFIQHFLELCPPHSAVLDAACGTGKYWPLILASGRSVVGADQSRGMLSQAHAKFPHVPVEKIGLQEISHQAAFAGAICVDAMENIFPEDWPLVLGNLHRALKPGGHLYFTVELAEEQEVAKAYAAGRALGLPLVYGEWAHEGAYHYYPSLEQVKAWVQAAGLEPLEEGSGPEYHHFLVRRPA